MGVNHCDRWPEYSFGCRARLAPGNRTLIALPVRRGGRTRPLHCLSQFLSGGRLTNKVDVWALGVLAYQLLTTQPSPFAGADAAGTPAAIAQENARIQDADFCLDALEAAPLSRRERHEAGHLIGRCLQAQPRTRPSVEVRACAIEGVVKGVGVPRG